MKLDLETNEIYTDNGEYIKTLRCPLPVRWEQFRKHGGSPHRVCEMCERTVMDTAGMSDAELLSTVRAEPGTCLHVSTGQRNVTVVRGGNRFR